MSSEKIGLYVHVPFCLHKCNYCDFVSFCNLTPEEKDRYVFALLREIESYRGKVPEEVSSIYFGGGTPSLLSSSQFEKINDKLRDVFEISPDIEFTVEVNPAALSQVTLDAFIRGGVNRVSIGLQSVHENEQKTLGRIHDYKQFLDTYSMITKSGISNINVDLMYAFPGQTKESFNESIDKVLSLSPSHISAYSLIIEDGTPFGDNRKNIKMPSEDDEMDMAKLLCKKLFEAGFSHYEISNFAKPGYEAKHNFLYWKNGKYLGFGVSAYSYYGGVRYGNSRNLCEYLSDNYQSFRDTDVISKSDEAYEYAMLGLRLKEGISLSRYKDKFGVDFLPQRKEKIMNYVKDGFMLLQNDRVSLTEKGFYVSNTILSEIL